MRFAKFLTTGLLCVSALAFITSCDENGKQGPDNPDEKEETVFELKSDEVNISADGGQASMPYTLENPIDSLAPEAQSPSADWVYRF